MSVGPASPKSSVPDDEHLPSSVSAESGALDRRARVVSATSAAVGADAKSDAEKPAAKRTWKSFFAAGLTPREVGIACGLGVAIGISPLPGLHMALAVFVAWMWRLNAPLVLLSANISFGPLLLLWYAAGIAIGHEILSGEPLMHTWPILVKNLKEAEGFTQELLVLKSYFWAWFLGTSILMVVAGPIFGFIAFVFAKSLKKGKDSLTRRLQRKH